MTKTAYLLCGLPGTGKTTYAKKIENDNIIRLSLDDELFKLFGKDFPSEKYSFFEEETKKMLFVKAIDLINDNKSVILDWGFWKKEEREEMRTRLLDCGINVKLIYFKVSREEMEKRINNRDISDNHIITTDMLNKFFNEFEEPNNEEFELFSA